MSDPYSWINRPIHLKFSLGTRENQRAFLPSRLALFQGYHVRRCHAKLLTRQTHDKINSWHYKLLTRQNPDKTNSWQDKLLKWQTSKNFLLCWLQHFIQGVGCLWRGIFLILSTLRLTVSVTISLSSIQIHDLYAFQSE